MLKILELRFIHKGERIIKKNKKIKDILPYNYYKWMTALAINI